MSNEEFDPQSIDIDALKIDELDLSDSHFSNESFEPDHVQEIVDKLIHLGRFGNLLTLVMGQTGSGKSYIIERFIDSLDDSQICPIKAQPLMSIDQLFQMVIEAFAGTSTFTGIPMTAKQYEEWAEQLTAKPGNRLLIIDDAEVLSTSVLHELCQLSAIQQAKETPHLQIILFGSHDLSQVLEQAAQGVLKEDGIYTIDIPKLTSDEAREWLNECLKDEDVDIVIDEDDMSQILIEGNGNFQKLRELVTEYEPSYTSDDGYIAESEYEEVGKISFMGYWFGALTLVIVGLISLFIYQEEVSHWLGLTGEQQEVVTSVPSNEILNLPEQVQTTESQPEEEQVEEIVSGLSDKPTEVKPSSQEELNQIAAQTDPIASVSTNIKGNEEVSEQSLTLQAEEPEVSKDEITQIVEPVIEKTVEEQPQKTKQPVYTDDETELLSQPDSAFALQMIGLTKESSIKQFIEGYPDLTMRYYRSSLKGNPWHIVVLGSYASKQEAEAARAQLPAALRKNQPWAKSYRVIKAELKAAVENN